MAWLIGVSLVWSFAFGAVKVVYQNVPASSIVLIRLFLAWLLTLILARLLSLKYSSGIIPPKRLRSENSNHASRFKVFLVGAIQFGIMYVAYTESFRFLGASEVAILTLTTPIYVAFFSGVWRHESKLRIIASLLSAALGTVLIQYNAELQLSRWLGIVWLQLANISFAYGQVWFAWASKSKKIDPALYLRQMTDAFGGALVVGMCYHILMTFVREIPLNPIASLTKTNEVATLLYLGLVSSALCFLAWNWGAQKVGSLTLAIFNTIKIPLAVIVSGLFFSEMHILKTTNFILGTSAILFALAVAHRGAREHGDEPSARRSSPATLKRRSWEIS